MKEWGFIIIVPMYLENPKSRIERDNYIRLFTYDLRMLYPLALSNMIDNVYSPLTSHVILHWLKTRLCDDLPFVDVD